MLSNCMRSRGGFVLLNEDHKAGECSGYLETYKCKAAWFVRLRLPETCIFPVQIRWERIARFLSAPTNQDAQIPRFASLSTL